MGNPKQLYSALTRSVIRGEGDQDIRPSVNTTLPGTQYTCTDAVSKYSSSPLSLYKSAAAASVMYLTVTCYKANSAKMLPRYIFAIDPGPEQVRVSCQCTTTRRWHINDAHRSLTEVDCRSAQTEMHCNLHNDAAYRDSQSLSRRYQCSVK